MGPDKCCCNWNRCTIHRTNKSYQSIFMFVGLINRKRFSREEIKGTTKTVSLLKRNWIQRMQGWTAFDKKSSTLNCTREKGDRSVTDKFKSLRFGGEMLREIASDGFYFLRGLKNE